MDIKTALTLKRAFDELCDGNKEAATALIFIKGNFKEWQKLFVYFKKNNLKGQRLVDFFKNESPDGGGFLLGVQFAVSRLEGKRYDTRGLKIDELK